VGIRFGVGASATGFALLGCPGVTYPLVVGASFRVDGVSKPNQRPELPAFQAHFWGKE
jgi:hypothetical protein